MGEQFLGLVGVGEAYSEDSVDDLDVEVLLVILGYLDLEGVLGRAADVDVEDAGDLEPPEIGAFVVLYDGGGCFGCSRSGRDGRGFLYDGYAVM